MRRGAFLVAVGLLTALSLLVSSGSVWADGQLDRRIEDRQCGGSKRPGPAGGPDGHVGLRQPDERQERSP